MKKIQGKEFGNYKIIERIDGQEFSTTFKAVHKFTGDYYAIKIAYSSNPKVIYQLKEIYTFFARNTIQLIHPNIVSLQDFFIEEKEGVSYFVLVSEYIHGQMLDDFLASHPNLSDKAKMVIAKQIGAALNYAHNFTYTNKFNYEVKGIMHGDLQAWNILVQEDLSTIVTDFEILNIKRLFNFTGQLDTAQEGLLEIHSIKNSVGENTTYYAPEQANQNIISVKSDIYHYGQILFFLYAGTHLKTVFPNGQWNKKRIKEALAVKNIWLRKKLGTIIFKATQPLQKERYGNTTQMLQALHSNYNIKPTYTSPLVSVLSTVVFMVSAFLFYQYLQKPEEKTVSNFSSSSISATKQPVYKGATPLRKSAINTQTGTYHALLIGNEAYDHLQDLSNPINDIYQIKNILQESYTFQEEHIQLIQNGDREAIITSLESLNTTTEADKVLILYAGHGKVDKAEKGFWLPTDATNESMMNWVSNEAIKKILRDIPARNILLISDACFSGSILRRRNPEPTYSTALHKKSRIALTSGSIESVPDYSVFIKYLAKCLRESPDSILTASEIFSYLQEPVKVNSPDQNDPSYGAIKDSGHEGGDFFFVRKKSSEKPN